MIRKLRSLGVKLAEKLGLYSERPREYLRLIYQLVRPIIIDSKQHIVLDLGCGSGWLTKSFQKIAMAVGVDVRFSPSWNDRKECCFVVADARFLPIADNTVDIVIALSLLEHVDDWQQILCEAFRVLRAGGVLVIQLPNLKYPIEPHTKFPLLYLVPQPLKQTIAKLAGYPELKFDCTIENVLEKAQEIGFKIQGVLHHYHGKKHTTIVKMLAKVTPPHTFFLVLQKPHTSHLGNS